MRGLIVGVILLSDRFVVQYTCECDPSVDFLQDRMLDCYCPISPYSRFAMLDGPYMAKNFGKGVASQKFSETYFPLVNLAVVPRRGCISCIYTLLCVVLSLRWRTFVNSCRSALIARFRFFAAIHGFPISSIVSWR